MARWSPFSPDWHRVPTLADPPVTLQKPCQGAKLNKINALEVEAAQPGEMKASSRQILLGKMCRPNPQK
jgi:hypothetical protein